MRRCHPYGPDIVDSRSRALPAAQSAYTASTPNLPIATAIKAFMRCDVDAIVVGELSHDKPAQSTAAAVLAGYAVGTTIHARNAESALHRLYNWGVSSQALARCRCLVVSQRLVKRLCHTCSSDDTPPGCPMCRDGYDGRVALVETLDLRTGQHSAFGVHAQSLIEHKVTTEAAVAQVLGAGWREEHA